MTRDGVPASWEAQRPRSWGDDTACALATCKSVSYDAQLGVMSVGGCPVASARLLIRMEAVEEDEEFAVPDPSQQGLRVTRMVRCALDREDAGKYPMKTAGLAASVQWLMTAKEDSVYSVVVTKGSAAAFSVLARCEVPDIEVGHFETFMKEIVKLEHTHKPSTAMDSTMTPIKRQGLVHECFKESETAQPITRRRRLNVDCGN